MKQLNDFIKQFRTSISLDSDLIIEKHNRYFLLNQKLKELVSRDFFYAGTYLGKIKNKIFFPSFNLLAMIAKREANKIVIDAKTEWLFICGRDIFKQGITQVIGSRNKGEHTLVLNKYGECLGFGKILNDLDEEKLEQKVVVKNILDIGDFLRREKKHVKNS